MAFHQPSAGFHQGGLFATTSAIRLRVLCSRGRVLLGVVPGVSWRVSVEEDEQAGSYGDQSVAQEPGALFFTTLRAKDAAYGQHYTKVLNKMKCFRCHSQVRLKDMPGRLVKLGRLESMPGRLVKPGRRGPRVQAALGAGFVMIGETGEVGVVFFRRRDIHWHVGSGPQAPASQDLSLAVGSGAVDVATGGEYVRAVEDPGCHERRYHDYGIRFRVRQVLHVAPLGVEDFHMRDEVEVWR